MPNRPRDLNTTRRLLDVVGIVANGFGATEVLAFLLFLAPTALRHGELGRVAWRSVPVFVVYMAIVMPVGRHFIEIRPLRALEPWLQEGRPATESERALVLSYPRHWALLSFVPWSIAAGLFSLMNLSAGANVAAGIAVTIVLGGLTSCSLQYLVVEWIMRPITARALAENPPQRSSGPGVGVRLVMAWLLATGVPVLGIVALGILDLTGSSFSRTRIVAGMVILGVITLSVGLEATLLVARAVAGPLSSIRKALAKVEDGDFSARVTVDDGSEVGLLETGFNQMASGLAERDLLRNAFGAFVDPSLTERVLREGTDLAGEEVDLSLLFMDIRGFTAYAEHADARRVFARLNDLYRDVVPIVLRHGGHANKFIGDGLLAVFGAPDRLDDHAQRAVAAGQEIVDLVNGRYEGELTVGVGINSGRVVVGTIGG
ncbi:MAG TPA: adenylate/guanylate cyclase domain-containing protein, partial [Actinomycetota bacterium]|nr:adenylate/guanylate cyclase domain-containing protein [Actinomycetota bacterium]